jgi:hypothetical protein
MTYFDQDLADAARDAAQDAYDDRPTAAEIAAEARMPYFGWSRDRVALTIEEYDRDRSEGDF